MPANHENCRIVAAVEGTVLYSHFEAKMAARARDGTSGYATLIDARNAVAEFTTQDVHRMVDLLEKLLVISEIGPMAVVVSNNVTFGTIRMLGTLAEQICLIQPFRNRAEAQS